MRINEGTCDERWVLYASDESMNATPGANIALYAFFYYYVQLANI